MNVKQALEMIAGGQTDALETLWMEAIEAGAPAEAMAEVLTALSKAELLDTAEMFAVLWLDEGAAGLEPGEALIAARATVTAVPPSDELRGRAAELYRKVHTDHPHLETLLRASGLSSGQSPRRAFQTLRTCLAVEPGSYLANRFDHRVIQVESFDDVLGEYAVVDASGTRTHMEPKALADEFDVVDADDFRVLCQFRGSELPQRLADDPAGVLTGMCMSNEGRIDATELKDRLVPKYIPADQWSRWWSRARTAVKRCERLSLEGRSPVEIVYHPGGRSLEDELAGAVRDAKTPLARLSLLQQYARECRQRKTDVDPAFIAPIVEGLVEQAERFRTSRPSDAVTAVLGLAEAQRLGLPVPSAETPTIEAIMAEASDPAGVVAGIEDQSLWPAALDALAKRDDAADALTSLLGRAPAGMLGEVARRLTDLGAGETVARAAATAVTDPLGHLEMCLWLWERPDALPAPPVTTMDLLTRLLNLVINVQRDATIAADRRKTIFQRLRQSLGTGDFATYRRALQATDEAVAGTLRRLIERAADGLAASVHESMLELLGDHHAAVFNEQREVVYPWADEKALYTTAEALARREAEYKELTEVKMLANAKAIGEAADHGDLSENSEWKFALEERNMLQQRAVKMAEELARARVLHAGDVPVDSVGIGSRVTMRRAGDDAELTVTFLGPWDADVDNRIYSYRSQLAQDTMGKGVGDTVTVKIDALAGEYTIVSLASAVT